MAFYSRYYRLILTVAQQRLGGTSEAEDITAEVFRIAWAHQKEGGTLTLAWIYQVLWNVVGHEYRRLGRAPRLTDDLTIIDFATLATPATDAVVDLRRELFSLSPSDRELLFMAYWEDLTCAEMANILGCSVPSLRVRLHRARRRLEVRLHSSAPTQALPPLPVGA